MDNPEIQVTIYTGHRQRTNKTRNTTRKTEKNELVKEN